MHNIIILVDLDIITKFLISYMQLSKLAWLRSMHGDAHGHAHGHRSKLSMAT